MDRKEHMIIGGLVGLGGYLFFKFIKQESVNLIDAGLSSLGGALVGLLPDILEPATNPNHRSKFHSIATLLLIIYGNKKVWQNENLTEKQKEAISILSIAYGSHLITDSTTKKSLPLIL